MNSADINPKKKRVRPGIITRFAGGLLLLAVLGACSGGADGVSAYQGDSSYGCKATATKTICPR